MVIVICMWVPPQRVKGLIHRPSIEGDGHPCLPVIELIKRIHKIVIINRWAWPARRECLDPFDDQLHGSVERIKAVPRRSFPKKRSVAWGATTIFGWTCP